MTTLAINRFTSSTAGLSRTGSGTEAKRLGHLVMEEIERLASGWSDRCSTFTELCLMKGELARLNNSLATIDAAVINLASKFLTALPLDFPEPELAVDNDGEITFDWFGTNGKNFSVSLRSDGRVAYAGAFGPGKTKYGTDRFDDEVPTDIVEAVQQLAGTSRQIAA